MQLKKVLHNKTVQNKINSNADACNNEKMDAEDEIVVSKTYEPPQIQSQLPLSNIKIRCLSDHGTIIDVNPDGNCGYYAVMKGLLSHKLIDDEIPINVFRKDLRDYAIKHRTFFCGSEKIDAKYIDISGSTVAPFVQKLRNRRVSLNEKKKDQFFQQIIDVIYQDDTDYSTGVSDTNKWWHSMHVGPIVAKKYDINLISYDGYKNSNMMNKKTHMFTKCYIDDEVIYDLKNFWHEPLKSRAIHIIGDGFCHFRYFEPTPKRRTPRHGNITV